jgi:alkylated DNA repair dioxygenase AlkB
MRKRPADQYTLFDSGMSLPNGFVYRPEFITLAEEEMLLHIFKSLPFVNAPYHEYTAQRRIIDFGQIWERDQYVPAQPIPDFLRPCIKRIAKWLVIPEKSIVEALVTEYTSGAGVGWHKDSEPCETIVGISLAGWADMQMRYLPRYGDPKQVTRLSVEPRSAYVMQKDSRYKFQHRIMPVETLRYSITFRTAK